MDSQFSKILENVFTGIFWVKREVEVKWLLSKAKFIDIQSLEEEDIVGLCLECGIPIDDHEDGECGICNCDECIEEMLAPFREEDDEE